VGGGGERGGGGGGGGGGWFGGGGGGGGGGLGGVGVVGGRLAIKHMASYLFNSGSFPPESR